MEQQGDILTTLEKVDAMSMTSRLDGRVAHYALSGLVTGNSLRQLVRNLPPLSALPEIRVCVASYERAMILVSAATLNSLFYNIGPDSVLLIPAALIVPPGAYDAFRQHAWDVAQHGIVRKVFTDAAPAQEWAALWV